LDWHLTTEREQLLQMHPTRCGRPLVEFVASEALRPEMQGHRIASVSNQSARPLTKVIKDFRHFVEERLIEAMTGTTENVPADVC
jgi:hypothetical protein